MSLYRKELPQLGDAIFLTDGGLETTLIFHHNIELPLFAAFDLLKDEAGVEQLKNYYHQYVQIAKDAGLGFILESPTWRASSDWGQHLGYSRQALAQANHDSIALLEDIRADYVEYDIPLVISGCIGPRGDGYQVATFDAQDEKAYHQQQVQTFSETAADLVSAITMTSVNEAVGIALAAQDCDLPVVISFTVETDGRLPSGETIEQAITLCDQATGSYPAYYMVNCAHPSHFEHQLPGGKALARLKGVRANASKCSHEELDESPTLDDGNPAEFGKEYGRLKHLIPGLTVVGGCCGTDHRHIQQICRALHAA